MMEPDAYVAGLTVWFRSHDRSQKRRSRCPPYEESVHIHGNSDSGAECALEGVPSSAWKTRKRTVAGAGREAALGTAGT